MKAAISETSVGTKLRKQKTVTFQTIQLFIFRPCGVSNPPSSDSVHKNVASHYLIINSTGDTRFGLVHMGTVTANGRRNSRMSSSPTSTELLSGLRTAIQNYEAASSASIVTKVRKQRPTISSSTPDKHHGLFSSQKRSVRL